MRIKRPMQKKDCVILGIESSCDETAAAVVRNGREVLSNIISSQIDIHTVYGGVVPEIASRLHCENINGVIRLALKDAGMTFSDIDAIAVTYGPGLVGALLVGVSEAKALSYALGKPLVGVHHIEGHVAANFIQYPELEPPFVCLIVSGGHTHLVIVRDYGEFEIIGRSRDDAAGEAYDKVARAVGLGYPGGPKVDKASQTGNPHAIVFPEGEVKDHPYDFTFSGLKSAVLNYINKANMTGTEINVPDLCASFQYAVVDALVSRTLRCAKEQGFQKVAMAGGVSANSTLRKAMEAACRENGMECYYPAPVYCTDNAAMIAAAGYYEYQKGVRSGTDLNAVPNLKLGER
ncbi:MAG: tRNA (adenosine(37)-N6)-threonylcarbamoyltransferase complex transferase subunit TsaD [Eubacteriales bacterium]|nr:tRNA (adenosine(37)-N6)-threonylcarbamoyltransferase complex transferase subunit TsaD [Eubacteriales bacterium]